MRQIQTEHISYTIFNETHAMRHYFDNILMLAMRLYIYDILGRIIIYQSFIVNCSS